MLISNVTHSPVIRPRTQPIEHIAIFHFLQHDDEELPSLDSFHVVMQMSSIFTILLIRGILTLRMSLRENIK